MSDGLAVTGLRKVYGRDVVALRGVDLHAKPGEFITLLGPSGSGKTTLLMLIAGFETPTSGHIVSGNTDITAVPPERRNFGVVFQSYALFPHMSVYRNIAYPLSVRRTPRSEREALVHKAVSLVGLQGLEDRRPAQLSGGQQQRVALARALVYEPSILLLDEPLGALDRSLRERMQTELRRLHREIGVTFLYVTHDQDEALTMSDRIAVLNAGRIEQIGTPQELYRRPATEFVASFVGTANILRGKVTAAHGEVATIDLEGGGSAEVPTSHGSLEQGDTALVVIRPESIQLEVNSSTNNSDSVEFPGVVDEVSFGGNLWKYSVRTSVGSVTGQTSNFLCAQRGDEVIIRWSASDAWGIRANRPNNEA